MYPKYFLNLIESSFVQVLRVLDNEASKCTVLTTTLVRCDGSTNHTGSGIYVGSLPFRFVVLCLSSVCMNESSSATIARRYKQLLDDLNSVV